jgi:methionyl aminopeptidase
LQPERVGIDLWGPSHHPALRRAGRAAAGTLSFIGRRLAPGTRTLDIDHWVRADTERRGGRPSQLGYRPHPSLPAFPAAVCVSPDDVVCHGVPSASRVLGEGSIVNVDVTTELGGFHGDTSATFAIGTVSPEARHVLEVARRCRDAGIAAVRPGARLGDIGAAIEELARAEGCSVVTEFGGHGIGRKMHAEPHIPQHGRPGTGLRLRTGMVFTIEPMVNLGNADVRTLDDGWTVVTCDGSLSAQFEHTVLVTPDGVEILTLAAEDDDASPAL